MLIFDCRFPIADFQSLRFTLPDQSKDQSTIGNRQLAMP